MPVYEAICRTCGQIVAKSKNIPEKDYYKLFFMAQQRNCPHCNAGLKGQGENIQYPFEVRVSKTPHETLPGVRRLPI